VPNDAGDSACGDGEQALDHATMLPPVLSGGGDAEGGGGGGGGAFDAGADDGTAPSFHGDASRALGDGGRAEDGGGGGGAFVGGAFDRTALP